MVSPESEFHGGHEVLGEPLPWWKSGLKIHKDLFPEGSLGSALLPDILVGRRRPPEVFEQPLTRLQLPKKVLTELKGRGLETVAEALNLSETEYSSLSRAGEIRDCLSDYLQQLAVTPHARVLEGVFGGKEYSVPCEREPELVEAVEGQIKTLSKRRQEVLRLRFGLDDGRPERLQEVGRQFQLSRERIRQIEAKALQILRHPSRSKHLKGYLSLPEESFGREILGAAFKKDLPRVKGTIFYLPLSTSLQEKLGEFLEGSSLDYLIELDLSSETSLSVEEREEVGRELRRFIDANPPEPPVSEPVLAVPKPKEESPKPAIGDLLLKVSLTPEHIDKISQLSLEFLGLSTPTRNFIRRYLRTGRTPSPVKIVEVLPLEEKELLAIRGFRQGRLTELKAQVEKLIAQAQRVSAKDFTPTPLEPYRISPSRPRFSYAEKLIKKQEMTNKQQEEKIREIIALALAQGLTSPREIQEFLMERMKTLPGLHPFGPGSFVGKAVIEYVLNHPED